MQEPETDKELLDWELSLSSEDLRSHVWYHGNINRQEAEKLLQIDGDFLIRDCSSGRRGDFVLTCRWNGANLHFLIQQELAQKQTIYEKRLFRLEGDSFSSVQDLITFYVGNKEIISEKTGARISNPKNRIKSITKGSTNEFVPLGENAYASLSRDASYASQIKAADAYLKKTSTLELSKQTALNLQVPEGLLEELGHVEKREKKFPPKFPPYEKKDSDYDLADFSSLLIPLKLEDGQKGFGEEFFNTVNTRMLEASDRNLAFTLTKYDWLALHDPEIESDMYERLFHDSGFRWNSIIERSMAFSEFILKTIEFGKPREEMMSKWIRVAQELKTGLGNIFSFCSIMRALTLPSIIDNGGLICWPKLRSEYTETTFTFETTMRNSYNALINGTESLPPITTLPNIFIPSIILEDEIDLSPPLKNQPPDEHNKTIMVHLMEIRNHSKESSCQKMNFHRLEETIGSTYTEDIILIDIFRTELHLLSLWGEQYQEDSFKTRYKKFI